MHVTTQRYNRGMAIDPPKFDGWNVYCETCKAERVMTWAKAHATQTGKAHFDLQCPVCSSIIATIHHADTTERKKVKVEELNEPSKLDGWNVYCNGCEADGVPVWAKAHDTRTGEAYFDLVCPSCYSIIATIQRTDAAERDTVNVKELNEAILRPYRTSRLN